MIYRFFSLLIYVLIISSCVATDDNSSNNARPTAVISRTPTTQNPSEPTSTASQNATSAPSSLSESGPPICADLPRPAMVFWPETQPFSCKEQYILRHVASNSECTMQFDPPVSRLLAMAADGIYYVTCGTGEESSDQKFIHYANDGTITELPFTDVDNIRYFVISSNGSQVAWSLLRIGETTEDEEIVVSELYSAKADSSEVRLLHRVDNAAEVKRDEPFIAWMIQPLRFVDDSDLLFTVQPSGRGGSWNSSTGRYSNLYQKSLSGGDATLVYECPEDDYSSFCIGDISADNDYFAVTAREAAEITIFRMDGTPVAIFSGPGQDYIGFPTFGPTGDLVFMSADVADDQITIEQAIMSLVTKPYEKAATTLLREPVSFIWEWVDEQHILYTAVEDIQPQAFSKSLVKLDGVVERLPETYGHFQGVLP